jgi:hypothetical protein
MYSPEIDIAVIAEKVYTTTPTAADAFAFIEVSDSTYREDRDVYVPLYVAAGVPTWQVNIPQRQVDYYEPGSNPNGPPNRVFHEDETFEILGVPIRVGDLFLPR